MRTRPAIVGLLILGLSLPFIGKPVHIDDANFLALARAARSNPWAPHELLINWQGTTERAFDVLSNPPGVAWWLAPVADAPVWAMHLWMLPWLALALWGAWRLGERFADDGAMGMLLLGASPIAVLATQALTPDLPLLACVLAGLGGIVSARRPWPWALVLGASALFRYSGAALIPIAALWPLLRSDRRPGAALQGLGIGLVAAIPMALLATHDLLAYGQIHLLAMVGFQGVADTPWDLFRKIVAALAMLGGAAVLPLVCWRPLRGALGGGALGMGLGALAAAHSGQLGAAAWGTVIFSFAGGAVLGGALFGGAVGTTRRGAGRRDGDALFLLTWLGLGLLFLLRLRFMAARYWLPFYAPALLLGLRQARRWQVFTAAALTPLLALALAADDARFARAQQALAKQVAELGTGLFAGHWGWQHTLEDAGWSPLEEDAVVPEGTLFAVSQVSWPQEAGPGCLAPVERLVQAEAGWGPRVHSARGAANIHAFLVSGRPPVETYSPWTFADDPLDTVTVWRGCQSR